MLKTKKIEYQANATVLEGYYAYDDAIKGPRPAVLVAHDWSGRNPFSCQKAEKLASLGYVGFALDMYGKGVVGQTTDQKMKLMQPLLTDRRVLAERLCSAYETVKHCQEVDPDRIGAMGFCFGGLCALDFARKGLPLRGVVSFHGLLTPLTQPHPAYPIQAKILVLHGHDDPLVPPEAVSLFQNEMARANADWQMVIYGNTLHAFTNPEANDFDFGTVYNATSATRAWMAMQAFFEEVFK